MRYYTKLRTKLPRNKYGKDGNTTFLSGSVSLGDTVNANTGSSSTNTVVNNIYENEWYNIQNKIVHSKINTTVGEKVKTTWVTVIENYKSGKGLGNSDNYRFVLMRLRKQPHEGRRWRIPMFSNVFQKVPLIGTTDDGKGLKMTIAEQDTWWSVKGAETEWWSDSPHDDAYRAAHTYDKVYASGVTERVVFGNLYKTYDEVISVATNPRTHKFNNVRNRKMLLGCAIFKKTGEGALGWQRVSNVATITLYSTVGMGIQVEANKTI